MQIKDIVVDRPTTSKVNRAKSTKTYKEVISQIDLFSKYYFQKY